MFTPHKGDTAGALPWEQLPAAAGTYKAGQLLNVTGGKLAAISAASTTTPPYLCMADITVQDGDNVPVSRVQKTRVYASQLSAAAAGAVPGTKLQIAEGGLLVNNAAAGSFEVVSVEGTEEGDTIYGRFL